MVRFRAVSISLFFAVSLIGTPAAAAPTPDANPVYQEYVSLGDSWAR